jgi:hypothetical protein
MGEACHGFAGPPHTRGRARMEAAPHTMTTTQAHMIGLAWNKVRPCLVRLNQLLFSSKHERWAKVRPWLVRLNQLLFSSKQQRRAKQLSKMKKTSKCKKDNCLIDYLLSLGAFTLGLCTQLDSYLFTTLQTNFYLSRTWLLDYKNSILLTLSTWTLAWSLLGL